nr:MAG: YpsA SLOG family protein [Bacteriophage sp.]
MSCLIITPEIRELAKKFPNETEQSILNLVGLWQEKNNKSSEDIPLGSELDGFIKELRKEDPIAALPISKYVNAEGKDKGFLTEKGEELLSISFDKEKFSEGTTKVSMYPGANGTEIRIDFTSPTTGNSAFAIYYGSPTRKVWDLFNSSGGNVTNVNDDRYWNNINKIVPKSIRDLVESGKYSEMDSTAVETDPETLMVKRTALEDYFEKEYNVLKQGRSTEYNTIQIKKAISLLSRPKEETIEERLSSPFDTPRITSVEEQQKVDLLFDPKTRRDRVTLIARFFSNEVDNALQEMTDSLKGRINDASGVEREELQAELNSLDRFSVIKKYTPAGIFKRVADIFNSYVQDTEEGRIQQELNKINAEENALIEAGEIDESERFSDEEKLEAAKKKAAYKNQEYKKIVDDPSVYKALAEEASTLLVMTEGIRIDPNYIAPADANLNDDDPDGNSEVDNEAEDWRQEEAYKDGWMTNFRQVSSHESLSQAVRKVIRQVPKLDYEGMYEEDDLGFTRYLDADYVHATFIDKLRNMINSDDMIPLLENVAKIKPWVNQIIELLQGDETLFSQFYQDFRKDFMPYWIQKKKMMPDGTFKIETIAINKPEGVYYLLDAWRDNYENGVQLDDDSVYEKNGEINKDNAAKGLQWTETLNNMFQNLDTESRLQLLEREDVWNTIMKLLHMLGIDANPSVLKTALTDIKTAPGITFTDPIMLLLPQLNIIFSGIKKGEVKSETREDGTEKRGDLINTFGSAYNMIASMMAEVTEDAIESSVRENDKSYYSHVTPNYLGKLIKNLKNVMNDKERFEQFMQTEFKDYEWFFKDGHWRNDWLRQLAESDELRRGLNHKVVLNSDKVDYTNWDDLDYTLALLTEYWGDPDSAKSSIKYAWYHVPILSDSPSAEFIRFRKYTTGDVLDENGKKRAYDDVILDKLVDLVNQEYDRIMLVRERDDAYQSGDKSVEPIANYDIVRKKDGSIKSIGGAEFKFLPALNNLRYDNGETFIDRLSRLKSKGTGAELRNFLRTTLNDIMEDGFEQTYKDWSRVGLLDELPNGKYKYLPFEGQSKQNAITAKALIKAKEALGSLWNTNMELILRAYSNNSAFDSREANSLMEQIKALLTDKATRGEIELKDAQSISRSLFVKNNAKDALREYYWNSKLATSQIIQLTTTDLAFYKNLEDFQKRYKEVHAPALRLNTKATYKGERIGRDWERTIYLKDDEIVSSVLEDIKTVLDERVRRNEMTKIDRDNIISKFRNVNVADAQAYRSLSSYRAILGMSGQWTDDMEQAYNNFKNGDWNIKDFNIIWQTKKPYVYTQVNNNSGIEGHTGIKTPVQHKNSEFLLLAMHELIAGPLGRSGKLKAINKFMEDNQIDVVQFESTTKVGKQGVIDLNDVNTEADVIQRLKDATGIGFGNENPNVVHKVSYEDYGIQTATPEHAIDAVQLVGTQIRKLITADISDDTIIEVNGKKMTKKEWLDLYNAINTENILQAFADVDEIFKKPEKVEEILLEEIRGNQRYGVDMMRACTLDENNNFNIPLFDPVQSQRVQTLLNSVIKSRITKQKIRGGALIQVSDYGLTDELHVVFEGEGANKRIKYLECYMPAYSREFYEPLMDPNTHQLDVTKLPEDLRKLIGYRVPTEDKYSMAPLYIKGFLPQQNGSAIMLPAEITTLSGSDFDVDKMYIMLPEFNIRKLYNIKGAWDDFYLNNPDIVDEIDRNLGEALTQFIKEQTEDWDEAADLDDIADFTKEFNEWLKKEGVKRYQFSETAQKRFSEWFKTNKKNYFIKENIEKIKYDFNKSPQENSLKARNNLLIDMMYGVLTNADTASKILNPGGFDYQKKSARIMTILNDSYESDLAQALKDVGVELNKTVQKGVKSYPKSIASYLFDLDLDTLDKLAEKTKVKMDPLSPRTQVILHQQNMTGAKLIGIYANHNANHALMQHTQLALDEENGSFVLNGKRLTSLHDIMNGDKEFISKNNAGFLAASVDNVKDPVLAALNQNTFTADASMLLSRLGYNPIEIGLLMMQPIVQEITQTYFRESREGKGKDTIIDEVLDKYKEKAALNNDLTYDNYKNNSFYIEELADNIMLAKEAVTDRSQTSDFRKIEFYQKQVAVGYLFKRIMNSADALGQLVQATRSDTQGGAAGPTIADTELKMQKVKDLLDQIENNAKFPLENADVISDSISVDMSIEDVEERMNTIRKQLLDSKLPFLQAFYTLGLKMTENMLSSYFPQYTESFRAVIDDLRDMTKTGKLNVKTMNSIYNDLLAYIMSKNGFFGSELVVNPDSEVGDIIVTSSDKRKDFINNFPEYFKRVVTDNEDIADLEFIKRLKVIRANDNNPVDTVVFKNVGQLSPTLRERYMRDWASLLYMSNPEAQKLALNLFRYSYYRNGFAFGPSTFIHLAPVAVRNAIPEYISTLRTLLSSSDDYSQFVDQYVYNHLDNRKLVPEIPDTASVQFIGEDNEVKDEVTFVIDDNATFGDKKVIKKRIDTSDGPAYDFFKYIGRRVRGKYIYYKLASLSTEQTNVATYERIEPLGFRNSFIEYEYGKDVEEMETVIDKNRKDYDPYADTLSRFDLGDADIDYDSMPDYQDMPQEYWDSIPQVDTDAFQQVYGTPLDTSAPKVDDVTAIQPNTEYKDENGDSICGAPTLYSL